MVGRLRRLSVHHPVDIVHELGAVGVQRDVRGVAGDWILGPERALLVHQLLDIVVEALVAGRPTVERGGRRGAGGRRWRGPGTVQHVLGQLKHNKQDEHKLWFMGGEAGTDFMAEPFYTGREPNWPHLANPEPR